ncbi:MAG: glycoside hydrolase family 38 C-terminal domain-containing protein [Pseudomonadota bacterium]
MDDLHKVSGAGAASAERDRRQRALHRLRLTREKVGARLDLIAPMVHRRSAPLPPLRILELDGPTITPPLEVAHEDWPQIPHHSYWGRANLNFLMKVRFTIPESWDARRLALHLPLGVLGDIFNHPEAMVYLDGEPLGSADRYHHVIPIPQRFADGREHELALHGWTGLAGWPPDPESRAQLYMGAPALVERCPDTLDFVRLAKAVHETATLNDDPNLIAVLDAAFGVLDTRDPLGHLFYASVPGALVTLRGALLEAGAATDVTLHGVGHAHMDVAYLWTIDQIRLKNQRTYSNVLRLMELDSGYKFSHSQPALYEMTKRDFPAVYEGIKAQVAAGRWEVMGGMWVEPDLNIPGPEALVRQLLLGRGFFWEEFGEVETPVMWLPDTFGFPGQLPQLMKMAGLKWFVTNKLNWNQINRVPWASHWWEGIDGTRVMAHILTTPRAVQYLPFPTNYKSDLSASEVQGTWSNAQGAARADLPICYGYGDGGGGPTEDLLAKADAYRAMPGMPRFEMSTVRAAMEALEPTVPEDQYWQGEHYMEGHRGVYTSQGWIKRANRKAEWALHEVEAMAALLGREVDLQDEWKTLCLHQFHDILTGTSITEVFDDAKRTFEGLRGDIEDKAAALLPSSGDLVAYNTAPTRGPRVALLEEAGNAHVAQRVEGGALCWFADLPGYSTRPVSTAQTPDHAARASVGNTHAWLDNGLIRVRVLPNGHVAEVMDLETGWQALAPGEHGNRLIAFEDRPICWDAWDIDPYFEDNQEEVTNARQFEVVENGPVRAAVRVTHLWRGCEIVQTIRLTAGSRRIDFETEIDWRVSHILLKVAFPANITAETALYDIQWGTIRRSTSRQSDFDAARFEVPAQKWALLSDHERGAALLNDCKYGYDIHGHVMRLSLIKSATSPDPVADQGRHIFTYSYLPLPTGDRAELDHAAYDLNAPLRVAKGPALPPLIEVSDGVIVESVRPVEGEIEFRLFEARREAREALLRFPEAPTSLRVSDIFGKTEQELTPARKVTLPLGKSQIVTLRARFK